MRPMSEMVERVARAIATADEQNGGPPYDHRVQDKHARQALFDEARAAIEAMREPTKAMSEIAVPEPTHLYVDRDEEYRRKMWAATMADRMAARSQWQRMIDAALASERKP